MSNSLVLISERVLIPATISRSDAPTLSRRLFGNVASAASAVSKVAARDSFVSQCVSLALSEMVSGDHSRLAAFEAYASTLPEYKIVKKDGAMVVSGKLGQLIAAYRQAVSVGAMVRNHADFDKSANEIDLQKWLIDSASFGALIALPEAKKVTTALTAPSVTTVQKPQRTESVASLQQKLAIEKNWFDRSLNACDSTGDFNPHMRTAAAANESRVEAARVEAARVEAARVEAKKAPKLFEDEFYRILNDNPQQAIDMLKRMSEFAGFALRALPQKKHG